MISWDQIETIDLILGMLLIIIAASGWRRGLIRTVLAVAGFLIGGFIGIQFGPILLGALGLDGALRLPTSVAMIIASASLGRYLAELVGGMLRATISFTPIRSIDSMGGLVINVAGASLLIWAVAAAIVATTGALATTMRSSIILSSIDRVTPGVVRSGVDRLSGWVDTTGLPRVFSGFGVVEAAPVPAPDPFIVDEPAVAAAARSVVRIQGEARGCEGSLVTGTGVVYAENRIMTNAHVVAGIDRPQVAVPGGDVLTAEVVHFDPETDVAVLRVLDLPVRPLDFGLEPTAGDSVVAMGYTGGGPLQAIPGRVRDVITARGSDIYGGRGVVRDMLSLRAQVDPGDSGGPVLDAQGRIIGLIFAEAVADDQTGYALTLSEIRDDARIGNRATTPVDVGRCASLD